MSGTPPSFRTQIRLNAYAVLSAANLGAAIFTSRDVALTDADLPALVLYTTTERKTIRSKSGSVPQYDCTAVLHVLARVKSLGTDGPDSAEAQMDALIDGVESALLSSPAFMVPDLRQVSRVEIDSRFEDAGGTVGEAVLAFHCDYVDQFDPVVTTALSKIVITTQIEPPVAPGEAPAVAIVQTIALPQS